MTMLWKWAFGMLLLLLTTQTHSLASTPPTTELQLGNACASLSGCTNCTNTYSCHWCEFDEECHARGSVHGCSWGSSCNSKPPKPKENTTCASQATCSECSLSSHLCHWCELDNACHAVGSRFGCSVGIDCYSNDRCRRSDPEHFHKWIVSEIPFASLLLLLLMGGILVGGLSCCHFCVFNVKGAYDDLATITMAASLPPSVIGGTLMMMGSTEPFYTTLETHPEGQEEEEPFDQQQANEEVPQDEEANPPSQLTRTTESKATENYVVAPNNEAQPQQQEREECETNHYHLMHDGDGPQQESMPFIPSSAMSFNGIPGMEEPRHMKALYKMCSILYYVTIALVVVLVGLAIYFYPKPPVYNVCSDAVAYKKIIENMVAMKLGVGFEILISLSNPNHVTAALDVGKGSFRFDGKHVGTYEIPPSSVKGMSVTDLMLIAKVTPDKMQALQMAEAYYRGKLVLEADFTAKLRVPALMDVTYNLDMKDITVYVNELGDRSLCHCPSWDEPNKTSAPVLFL